MPTLSSQPESAAQAPYSSLKLSVEAISAVKPILIKILTHLFHSIVSKGKFGLLVDKFMSGLPQSFSMTFLAKPLTKWFVPGNLTKIVANLENLLTDDVILDLVTKFHAELQKDPTGINLEALVQSFSSAQIEWIITEKRNNNKNIRQFFVDFFQTNPEFKTAAKVLKAAIINTFIHYKANNVPEISEKLFPNSKITQGGYRFLFAYILKDNDIKTGLDQFLNVIGQAALTAIGPQPNFDPQQPNIFHKIWSTKNPKKTPSLSKIRAVLPQVISQLAIPITKGIKASIDKHHFPHLVAFAIGLQNKHPYFESFITRIINIFANLQNAHKTLDNIGAFFKPANIARILKAIPDNYLHEFLHLLEQFTGNTIAYAIGISYESHSIHLVQAKKNLQDIFMLLSNLSKNTITNISRNFLSSFIDRQVITFFLKLLEDDKPLKNLFTGLFPGIMDILDPLEYSFHQNLAAFEKLLAQFTHQTLSIYQKLHLIKHLNRVCTSASQTSKEITQRLHVLNKQKEAVMQEPAKNSHLLYSLKIEILSLTKTQGLLQNIINNEKSISLLINKGSTQDYQKLHHTVAKIQHKLFKYMQQREVYTRNKNTFVENFVALFQSDSHAYLSQIRRIKNDEYNKACQAHQHATSINSTTSKLQTLQSPQTKLANIVDKIQLQAQLKNSLVSFNSSLSNCKTSSFFKSKQSITLLDKYAEIYLTTPKI